MFAQFSGQARRAVYIAYEEAQRLKQEYVGTEHLLVGILNEGSEGVGKLLTACGLEPQEVHRKVGFLMPAGLEVPDWNKLPLTPSAKRAFDCARDEAGRLKHPWVFPEHLLVAILRDQGSTAAFVMTNLGLTLPRLTTELARLPLPANRDSMLQAQSQPGRVARDPSSLDLEESVSHRPLPHQPLLTDSLPYAEIKTTLSGPQHFPTPAEQELAVVQRQLMALKVVVGCALGAWLGGLVFKYGGVMLGLAVGWLVAFIPNPIVTAIIGAAAGGYIEKRFGVEHPNPLNAPIVGMTVGFLLGICMGTWRRSKPANSDPLNPHTDPRSAP